jgi:tRNA (guanine26-N2/guanine27-N2)-dimethyltransferase
MQTQAQQAAWPVAEQLLQVMATEATMPPYFYTLGEIGRRGKLDVPQRSWLIAALQDRGYAACVTHIHPQALKTNASLAQCIALAKLAVAK